MSITKTALAAVLVLGSASLAHAQGFDPNLANRYPSYAEPGVYGYSANSGTPGPLNAQSLQSRNVALPQGTVHSSSDAWMDRASQNFGGGGY